MERAGGRLRGKYLQQMPKLNAIYRAELCQHKSPSKLRERREKERERGRGKRKSTHCLSFDCLVC